MKPESGISNRWELLESIVGVDTKKKFNAYGWYNDNDIKMSKDEHWCGWWNDCFDFISIFPNSYLGKRMVDRIAELFAENGWSIKPIVNSGISLHYETMTRKESDDKALRNLLNSGRMSD